MRSETLVTGQVEELVTHAGLESHAFEWDALWNRAASAPPFVSPAWTIPWWHHFGNDELLTLAIRREGRMVGLAPLFIHADPASGLRRILFVGNGVSDYLDILAERGSETFVVETMLNYVRDQSSRWDVCDFQ